MLYTLTPADIVLIENVTKSLFNVQIFRKVKPMAKPIIKSMSAPDATKAFDINFLWNGDRAYYNRVIITNNQTNAVAYDNKVETFNLYQTVAANRLSNGGTWIVQVSVFYRDPSDTSKFIESELSDKYIFKTLTTPSFSFAGLDPDADNKVTTSSYQAQIYYDSKESEQIESYMFSLYDVTKKFLFETDRFTDRYNITYTYRGLDNMTDYYIRCRAVTHYGIEMDTGLVRIHVKYQNPSTYSRIYATPLPHRGCIEVGSNLIVIEYTGNETFKYNDSQIILTDKTLYYNEGWELTDDFTVILKMQYMEYGQLIKLTNGVNDITVTARMYADNKTRFKLVATNGCNNYIIYSSPQVINYEDRIVLGIHKKNNLYALKVITDNSESTGDYWWGKSTPLSAEDWDKWIDTEETTSVMKDYDELTETIGGSTEPADATLYDIWITSEAT